MVFIHAHESWLIQEETEGTITEAAVIIQLRGDQWLKLNGGDGENGHEQSNQDRFWTYNVVSDDWWEVGSEEGH